MRDLIYRFNRFFLFPFVPDGHIGTKEKTWRFTLLVWLSF